MLTLHFCSNSRSQRVLWTLEELELPYTLNKIKFHPSELKSEEHKKRHPLGRVPVLEDDDVTLFESGAIIDYIIEKYDDNRELKPNKNSKDLLEEIINYFGEKGFYSYLTTLKEYGEGNRNLLSFGEKGLSITLDIALGSNFSDVYKNFEKRFSQFLPIIFETSSGLNPFLASANSKFWN